MVMTSKGGRRFGLWRLAYNNSASLAKRERLEYVCCWQNSHVQEECLDNNGRLQIHN